MRNGFDVDSLDLYDRVWRQWNGSRWWNWNRGNRQRQIKYFITSIKSKHTGIVMIQNKKMGLSKAFLAAMLMASSQADSGQQLYGDHRENQQQRH